MNLNYHLKFKTKYNQYICERTLAWFWNLICVTFWVMKQIFLKKKIDFLSSELVEEAWSQFAATDIENYTCSLSLSHSLSLSLSHSLSFSLSFSLSLSLSYSLSLSLSLSITISFPLTHIHKHTHPPKHTHSPKHTQLHSVTFISGERSKKMTSTKSMWKKIQQKIDLGFDLTTKLGH